MTKSFTILIILQLLILGISTVTLGNNSTEYNIKIIDIEEGLGITVTIKNEGINDVTDIILNVKTSRKFLILPREKDYEISEIKAGETIRIHIKLFGLGLGLIKDFPQISLTLKAQSITLISQKISGIILGPFIEIVGNFINRDESFEGYTLFTPEFSKNTYLINNSGEIVHMWKSNYIQGLAVYLTQNGNLIRTDISEINPVFLSGGIGGRVEIFDWNGTLIWEFEYSTENYCLHHDIEVLPNGNILMSAYEYKSEKEAVAAGRDPKTLKMGELWPDYIIEIKPNGTNKGDIIWEWHVWDHLVQDFDFSKENYGFVSWHPELIDINAWSINADFNHINSIDYNEELDQILLSSATQNEIWIIDHSTTTEEAAGHSGGRYGKGGGLLYRWGNPQVYRRGDRNDQKLFGQHDAQWIEPNYPGEGNILIFNNGLGRLDGEYSSIDEIVPPIDIYGNYDLTEDSNYGPEDPIWSYTTDNPTDFFSYRISGAQRLPNGNTLICDGTNGIFFEINPDKEIVWKYSNLFPDLINNQVFKIQRYSPDYPGLDKLFEQNIYDHCNFINEYNIK